MLLAAPVTAPRLSAWLTRAAIRVPGGRWRVYDAPIAGGVIRKPRAGGLAWAT
jgi:hypothetical protein